MELQVPVVFQELQVLLVNVVREACVDPQEVQALRVNVDPLVDEVFLVLMALLDLKVSLVMLGLLVQLVKKDVKETQVHLDYQADRA